MARRCLQVFAPISAEAGKVRDAKRLQELIDPHVLVTVHINPEARVKAGRGPAAGVLQQSGYTPVIVKVVNEAGTTARLRIGSPQAGPVYAGMSRLSGERMQQPHLRENENVERRTDRFLDLELFSAPPMTANLSGLEAEYVVALVYSSEAGRREAILTFDAGQGTQDLGFRAEVPVLFTVRPAVPVTLSVRDHDGSPTTARFQFADAQGHVFPPQAKRLAPDLFFQKQIYRRDGETVLLPPGTLTMSYGRGPEYRWLERVVTISPEQAAIGVKLERWIDPPASGFYSGDHHVHAAGCAHYTSPTDGVDPADMFRQIKGEGLNVGSILTWGPGFDHQHQFFAPAADKRSEPATLIEIRHRGQRLRLRGARPCRAVESQGADLSGCDREQGLAVVDAAGPEVDEGAGWRGRLRALCKWPPGRLGGGDDAPDRTARRERRSQAHRGRSRPRPDAGAVC